MQTKLKKTIFPHAGGSVGITGVSIIKEVIKLNTPTTPSCIVAKDIDSTFTVYFPTNIIYIAKTNAQRRVYISPIFTPSILPFKVSNPKPIKAIIVLNMTFFSGTFFIINAENTGTIITLSPVINADFDTEV